MEIEFGGKTRRLVFDFNAKAEIQEALGELNPETAGLKTTRAILYGALLADTLVVRNGRLRHTSATLSELEVGEILNAEIDADPDYIEKLTAAIAAAQKEAEPATANPPVAAQPSPSTTSGQLAATTSDSPTPISGA